MPSPIQVTRFASAALWWLMGGKVVIWRGVVDSIEKVYLIGQKKNTTHLES